MKNLFGILLGGLLILPACQPQSEQSEESEQPTTFSSAVKMEDSFKSLYAVPLDTAKKNIDRYDKEVKKIFKEIPIRAFTIRSIDFLEAMGMPPRDTVMTKYRHVRIYMGLNESDEFRLYLTPVDGANLSADPPVAGKDVILTGEFEGLNEDGPYMLDFTSPCPKTCPDGGPDYYGESR